MLSGLVVWAFELLAVPYLTPWMGINKSRRVSSMFEVPVYLAVPLLSWLNHDGLPIFLAVVHVLLLLKRGGSIPARFIARGGLNERGSTF